MDNFNIAIEANETALNSSGSAIRENEKYIDSIKGKLAALKSEWEKLSQSLVNSDLVKLVIDLGTALLKLANSGVGQFIIKSSLAVGSIALLKSAYNSLTVAVIRYTATQMLANKGITDFTNKKNRIELEKLTATLGKSGGFLKIFQNGLSNIKSFILNISKLLGPTGAIIGSIVAIVTASAAIEKSIYNLDKQKKALEKTQKELDEVNDNLETTRQRIEELRGFGYLSFTEQEELKRLEQQLYLLNKEKTELQEIYDLEEKRYRATAKRKSQTLLNEGNRIVTPSNSNIPSSDITPGGFKNNSGFGVDKNLPTPFTTEEDKQSLNSLIDIYDREVGVKQKLIDKNKELNITSKEEYEDSEELIESKNKLNEALKKYKDAYDLALESGDAELIKETWESYLEILKRVNEEEYNRINNIIPDADKSIEAYENLNDIVEKYNKTRKISAEDAQTLIDAGLRSAITFDEEGNAVALDTDAMWQLYKAKLEVQKTDIDDAANRTLQALRAEGKYVNLTIAQYVEMLKAKKAAFYAEGNQGPWAYSANEQSLIDAYERSQKIQGILNSMSVNTKGGSSGGSSGGGTSGGSSKAWWETQLEALKNQFSYNEITLGEYIKGLESLLGKLQKGSDAWREINKLLQEQKLKKIENDYKRGKISLDEYIKSLKELIKSYKEGTEAWNDLADAIKEGLLDKAEEQEENFENAADAAVDIINDEIDKLKTLKDEQSEYYDKLISDKEEANDETERELELARLQEALYNAQNEKIKRIYKEGVGWVWSTDAEAIREAQDALDEFNKEQEVDSLQKQKEEAISSIEEQIDAWEKYKKTWEDVADDYETAQARMTLAATLGADAEQNILDQKLDALERYKNGYLAIMGEIASINASTSDSLVGEKTAAAGNVTTTSTVPKNPYGTASSLSKNVGYGAITRGNSVKSVQWALQQLGYDLGSDGIDGVVGRKTNAAIKQFQRDMGISADGVVGKNTRGKLAVKGYSNGGVVDYTGYAKLHGTFDRPELVLNNSQAASLYSMLNKPKTSPISNNTSNSNIFNFDKLILPNVSNAKQFITELKSQINITKNQ